MDTGTAPLLEGTGLVLRPLCETDRGIVVANRDPEFLQMVGAGPKEAKELRYGAKNRAFDRALADPMHWVICVSDHCIGTAFLHSLVKNDKRARYAIGIFVPDYRGKGFGAEATRLVLDYAFRYLMLHRIDLRVLSYNKRAIRCYEKCGFVLEGVERESALVDGQWHDDLIMGILAHEHVTGREDR